MDCTGYTDSLQKSIFIECSCYIQNWYQVQTRADAEIVVYSGENQKPGDQRYEAQNDRQENSQGCPESKKQKLSKFNGVSYSIPQ